MKLKAGIIIDSLLTDKYVHDLVAWGKENEKFAITHAFIYDIPAENFFVKLWRKMSANKGIVKLISNKFYSLIVFIEKILLLHTGPKDHYSVCDIDGLIEKKVMLKPLISRSGFIYRFSQEDINTVREQKLDVLIRCGSGILQGDILHCCRFGIISFHHGDNRVNRGGPPGFWEVYYGLPKTGFIIQQLTTNLDGGIILCRGFFQTQWFFSKNQAFVYTKSNYYLKVLLESIADREKLVPLAEGPSPYYAPLYILPGVRASIYYIIKLAFLFTKRFFYKVASIRDQWSFSFLLSDIHNAVLWKGTKVRNPDGAFFADPFIIKEEGRNICFVEEFDMKKSKGFISAFELSGKKAVYLGPVLEETFHISFPYIFKFDGNIFMVPETSISGDIRLYKCVAFPMQWKLQNIIMKNVSAADPMIFFYDHKWWLFVNIDPLGGLDHSSELFIFYNNSPLSTDWKPHACNPVKIDSEGARNAGFFKSNDKMFRVGQNQGFDDYGQSITLFEIVSLSETIFEEKPISSVKPLFYKKLTGTHHISVNEDYVVYDHKILARS